ncbi:MAG: hypothetical protein ACD_16C00214G0005 [uncultured bacterium]|nr:MAG: hypothetical protein ACD_16C00214G0005 [uncultured bacterium]
MPYASVLRKRNVLFLNGKSAEFDGVNNREGKYKMHKKFLRTSALLGLEKK